MTYQLLSACSFARVGRVFFRKKLTTGMKVLSYVLSPNPQSMPVSSDFKIRSAVKETDKHTFALQVKPIQYGIYMDSMDMYRFRNTLLTMTSIVRNLRNNNNNVLLHRNDLRSESARDRRSRAPGARAATPNWRIPRRLRVIGRHLQKLFADWSI